MRTIFKILALLLLGFSQACGQDQSSYEKLSPMEFKARMEASNQFNLIDVRTAGEFQGGTIEGAKNLNYLSGEFADHISDYDPNTAIFIFCASGGRSSKAAALLKKNGFTKIYELKDGYSSWNQ